MWDKARIENLYVHQKDVTATVAHISIEAEVIASEDTAATLSVSYGIGEKRAEVSRTITLAKGLNNVDIASGYQSTGALVSGGLWGTADLQVQREVDHQQEARS